MHRIYIVGRALKYGNDALRLYRTDTKAVKDVKYVDLEPVYKVLDVGNFEDFSFDALRNSYPVYNGAFPAVISGQEACYVIGATGGGYVTLRPHVGNDFMRIIPRSRLVSDVKKGRIRLLNGVIEQIGGVDHVSPFSGEWEIIVNASGRALSIGDGAHDSTDTQNADFFSGADPENISVHDELGMLSTAQRDFLREYYIGYSVEAFENIAGKTKWTLKGNKLKKLVELRGLSGGESWCFAGLWDGGFIGAERCELGHKLRYVYLARPADETFVQAQQNGTLLKFGIVCHADFLDIPREDVARLGKLQDIMCDEIAFISAALANNELARHNELMSSMRTVLRRLRENGALETVVGARLREAADGFEQNSLPLVESFVLDVQSRFVDYGIPQVLSAIGIDISNIYQTIPDTLYALPEPPVNPSADEKKLFERKERIAHANGLYCIHRKRESYPIALTRYADHLFTNDICGEYAYDPSHELTSFRKRGAASYKRYGKDGKALKYNNQARELRDAWLKYFRDNLFIQDFVATTTGAKATRLSLDAFERALLLINRLRVAAQSVAKSLSSDALIKIHDEILHTYTTIPIQFRPQLLAAALPFNSDIPEPERVRHYTSFRDDAYDTLLALLDETRDGSDLEYLKLLRSRFDPKILQSA